MTSRRAGVTGPVVAAWSRSRSLLWLIALASMTMASHAAGQESDEWRGRYYSNSREQYIDVLLTIPSSEELGELEFVTLSCSVGLSASTGGPAGATVYTIQRREDAAGPYCGIWLGGTLETRPGDDPRSLEASVTSMSGRSRIEVTLAPVTQGDPGPRGR